MKTNWNDLFKVRLAKSDESMDFHDIVKILCVRKILRKNPKRTWLRIYTEFPLNNGSGIKTDICVEYIKNKSIVCYELQKKFDISYVKDRTEKYNKVNVPYFNSIDLIIIPLKGLSHNIEELNEELNKYIV